MSFTPPTPKLINFYSAPWNKLPIVLGNLLTCFSLGLAALLFMQREGATLIAGFILLALVIGCALFTVWRLYFDW